VPDLPLPAVLERWLAAAPQSRPALTHLGPDGTRIELSAATLANAVAKGVNLFAEELLLEPGDLVAVDLPRHWQVPVVVLSAWAAGLTVALGPVPGAAATLAAPGPGAAAPPTGEALAVSLHPWGLPLAADTPAGWQDWAALARMQPDLAHLRWPAAGTPWLQDGARAWSADGLLARAQELAAAWQVPTGGRLLTLLDPLAPDGLLALTAVPAAVLGSAVLAGPGADVTAITAAERIHASAARIETGGTG
jgi:uncharacterized protein (TIGR03089 family)